MGGVLRASIGSIVVVALGLTGIACNALLGNEDGVFVPLESGTTQTDAGRADSGTLVPADAEGDPDSGGGDLDAGPDTGTDCPTTVACASGKCSAGKCQPLVFVTLLAYRGDGLAGGDPGFVADGKCDQEGGLLQPLAKFFAWLGGSTTPAARQLHLVARPYWTPGSAGPVRIADNAEGLSAALLRPIARRDGTAAVAPPWTNVTASGTLRTAAGETCSTWTNGTAGGTGSIGAPQSVNAGDWAAHEVSAGMFQVAGCDVLRPLICFEDVTP